MARGDHIKKQMDAMRERLPDSASAEAELVQAIVGRLRMGFMDELGKCRAPRFIPGQADPKDRVGAPAVVERFGPSWSYQELYTLAADRVFTPEGLDEWLGPGNSGARDDLRPYLDPEGLELLKARLLEEMLQLHVEFSGGESPDRVNKWERERQDEGWHP